MHDLHDLQLQLIESIDLQDLIGACTTISMLQAFNELVNESSQFILYER